jgi:hypothetical protein
MANYRGRSLRLCCAAPGCLSARIPRSPISRRRRGAPRLRCSARPIRGCGGRYPPKDSIRCGKQQEQCSDAETSGWCNIPCRACRATARGVTTTSRVSAGASIRCSPRRCYTLWMRRWAFLLQRVLVINGVGRSPGGERPVMDRPAPFSMSEYRINDMAKCHRPRLAKAGELKER